ncbi:MAG: stage II sporulation protein M [Halohasta sp.]
MTVGTSLNSAIRVLADRPASVVPVYLLVVGLNAATRVPLLAGIGTVIALLAADGRLQALLDAVEAVDIESLDQQDPSPESIPPELEAAAADLVSPEVVLVIAVAGLASLVVGLVANGLSSAAAINGIYGCLYRGDGVADAVVGVGRDWKPFVGIGLAQLGVVLVGAVPAVLGASLFAVSQPAGIAATAVGGLLSVGIVLLGLAALAFAGQSIVVDGVGFGGALRRSVGFPFRRPVPFLAYLLVALGVFGGLGVLGGVFGALDVSQLSGIVGPLAAIPFLDAFKTALYADRPFAPADAAEGRIAAIDAAEADGGSPVDSAARPSYRHRITAAFRDGLAAVGGFIRGHPVPILAATTLFSLAVAGGWQLTAAYAVDLPAGSDPGAVFGTFPAGVFVMIAANNWLVSATAVYGGVVLGLPTAADMLLNGFIVGALAGVVDPLAFAALVAPHGVIELPAIVVAGGLGFHLAALVAGVFRGSRTSAELAAGLRMAYRVLLGLAVVLVVAAFIEAFLTPRVAEAILS